jgi:hypothetical protein
MPLLLYPWGKSFQYPVNKKLNGTQSWSGGCEKREKSLVRAGNRSKFPQLSSPPFKNIANMCALFSNFAKSHMFNMCSNNLSATIFITTQNNQRTTSQNRLNTYFLIQTHWLICQLTSCTNYCINASLFFHLLCLMWFTISPFKHEIQSNLCSWTPRFMNNSV